MTYFDMFICHESNPVLILWACGSVSYRVGLQNCNTSGERWISEMELAGGTGLCERQV